MTERPFETNLAYSVRDTAKLTSLSKSTIYNLVNAGRLPLRRIGGRSVILHDDLMALLASN